MKYLNNLSVELLKIDQYFIKNLPHDPENCTIVKSMIDLAHHLKIKVLAEGVETKEQFEYLQEAGCDQAQGFYFYRPMTFQDVEALISQSSEA
jgi:EAL domain-containing protein (putative c-di-GMP-specific phosphodiesterase class I)